MRIAFAVVVLLIVCLLAAGGYAQSMNRAQYVGGNFGQSWIGSYNAQNPQPAEQNPGNDLWTWGGAPKGSIIANGKLAPDPYYIWKSLNYTSGWMGEAYIDPQHRISGLWAHRSLHRMAIYFYVDPKTESRSILTHPATGYPYYSTYYGSISPFYSPNYWPGGYVLPPVFNSNNPWS
jgi:hypothetical protein